MKNISNLRERVYKFVQIFSLVALVFNMSFMGVFFVATPMAVAGDMLNSVPNPGLTESCGIDMVLIIDVSSSMHGDPLIQEQQAFKNFVDAFLPNTPTQMAVVGFETTAFLLQEYTDDLNLLKEAIDDASDYEAKYGNYTNWEDALIKAHSLFDNRENKPDLYVFASDGNPNRYGDGTHHSTSTALSRAIEAANVIKGVDEVRIVTLGIANENLDPDKRINPDNLIAISSEDAYYDTDLDNLSQALSELVIELCGGTLTVQKYIDDFPSDGGWNFSIDTSLGLPVPASGTTDEGGFLTFEINNLGNDTALASITEDTPFPDGFKFDRANCWDAQDNPVGILSGTTISDIEISKDDIISCRYYNETITGTYCGDGIVQEPNDAGTGGPLDDGYEVCDEEGLVECTTGEGYDGYKACANCDWGVCEPEEYCGDGEINGNEQCDEGTANNGQPGSDCDYDCTLVEEDCDKFIYGYKYEAYTQPAVGLNGWEIELRNASSTLLATTTTDNIYFEGYQMGDGFYVFENLCVGEEYIINEVNEVSQSGWTQINPFDPNYYTVLAGEDPAGEYNFSNEYDPDPSTVTIKAHKIVCESEYLLPNWDHNGDITATTAAEYVAATDGCNWIDTDWYFEWGQSELSYNGDYIGEVNGSEDDWYLFDTPSNWSVPAEAEISLDEQGDKLWFREVLQAGYEPFSIPPGDLPGSDISAEFYCDIDVEHYDNMEEMTVADLVSGNEYYCIAFNVLETTDTGSISGHKYEDQDGTISTDEYLQNPGVNWVINLFKDSGTTPIATATTSDSGYFMFTGLPEGVYTLTEVLNGWIQLLAPEGEIPIDGNHSDGNNFVNYEDPGDDPPEEPYCGDGEVNQCSEECDDGNNVDGDGCSSDCKNESSGGGTLFPTNRGGGSTGQSSSQPAVAGEEGAPALVISKTVDQEFVNIGDEVEYIITVTNNGSLTAFEVNLEDLLPEGLEFVDDESTSKTWDLGDIAPGVSKSATVIVKVTGDITIGKITNTATATAANHDAIEDTADVEVREVAVLAETGFSLAELMLMFSSLATLMAITLGLKRRLLA